MDINRSGYYKWLNRGSNQYERDRITLANLLKEEHKIHPSYGYHGLAKSIRDKTGWIFSDNLAHKVCKVEGIKSKMRHYRYKKAGGEHTIYNNKIFNNWKTTQPFQKIVSDMTMIRHKGILYEWTIFMDVYNNSIIAYDISRNHGDPKPYYNCRDKLLEIIKKEEIQGPIYFHTDQGPVYSSSSFNKALLNSNIIRSMSRAGTPTDNPIIESMNGWIKEQIKRDYNIDKYSDIHQFIKKYVHYYNYQRPMYKLKYNSPAEFTRKNGHKILF